MKNIAARIIVCLMLMLGYTQLMAQNIITVSGRILNLQDGKNKPIPFPDNKKAYIYAFNTVDSAQLAFLYLKGGYDEKIKADQQTIADSNGNYKINVAENGALVIYADFNYKLIEVKGNKNINVTYEGIGIALPEIKIEAEYVTQTYIPPTSIHKNDRYIIIRDISIPKELANKHNRLIIIASLQDCNNKEVIIQGDPIVIDGEKYKPRKTILSNGEKGDSLSNYIDHNKTLYGQSSIEIKDTIKVKDTETYYRLLFRTTIVNRSKIIYDKVTKANDCAIKQPLQFLEIPKFVFQSDPEKHKPKPRRERSELISTINANGGCKELKSIMLTEGNTVKELQIISVASPEGNYATNMNVAKQRAEKAMKWVTDSLPHKHLERIYKHPTEIRVATWEDMANLLEKDSLLVEANEIRRIVKEQSSQDSQYAVIKKLPYYETSIKERLPLLRMLQYKYRHESFRKLNAEEIINRYYNDADYRNGKKKFSRYEYWHLFKQITEPKEAEALYKRAYHETMEVDINEKERPWVLAANNLAASLLKQDTFDLDILEPLLEYGWEINKIYRSSDGIYKKEINTEDVVANQIAMLIRAKRFNDASNLAIILPFNDKFKEIKYFANCLGGNYDYRGAASVKEQVERKATFERVKNSSPMNNVVMCMAMNTKFYNAEARKALEKMEPTTQIQYLLLQLFMRENRLYKNPMLEKISSEEASAYKQACRMLDKIIKEDFRYMEIAEYDGELCFGFMDYFNDPTNWED